MFFRKIKELLNFVIASRKSLADAERKIVERNKLIEIQHDTIKELKDRVVDLENNVEFLYNNLTPKKKELVRNNHKEN